MFGHFPPYPDLLILQSDKTLNFERQPMWSVNATWESVTIPVLISNVLYLVKTCEYHLFAQKWWNSLSQQSLPTFPIFFLSYYYYWYQKFENQNIFIFMCFKTQERKCVLLKQASWMLFNNQILPRIKYQKVVQTLKKSV